MMKKIVLIMGILVFLNSALINYVFAEELENNEISSESQVELLEDNKEIENTILKEENTVYWEDVFNTGKDNGFSNKNEIKKGDSHYGWKIGKFALSGFSGKKKDDNENWVFLKNAGDEITLYFNLQQDINKLDGNDKLKIEPDKNGYDNEFNIKQTDFGRGCLIVRKIDSTGNKNEPEIYTDYLNGVSLNANTKINVYEEGDYEVALDYEVVEDNGFIFKNYNDYRIRFNFAIRNGNCMIFPFDVKTKQELSNTSITENGFYIDLANSQYLDVNIKKEVLKEGSEGLSEDIRFNRPVKSGEEFTEEGIYTITAKNNYTTETTIKKIYVGNNKILKAYVQTGRTIDNIKTLVNAGATIDNDGNINNIPKQLKNNTEYENSKTKDRKINIPLIVVLLLIIVFIIIKYSKSKNVKKIEKNIYNNKLNTLKDKYYKLNDNKYYLHLSLNEKGYNFELLDENLKKTKSGFLEYSENEEEFDFELIKDKIFEQLDIKETIDNIKEIGKEEFKNK